MEYDYVMGVDWSRMRDMPLLASMSSDTCAVYFTDNGEVDWDRFTRDQLNSNVERVGAFAAKLNFESSTISNSDIAMYAICSVGTALGAMLLAKKAVFRKNQNIFDEDKNNYFTVESEP